MASKNTFRNCNEVMLYNDSNMNGSKVNNVAKVVDNIMSGFMKRYLVVLAELEEMKREVMNNVAQANECINNIKKESNVNLPINNNIAVNDGVGSRHYKLQLNINIPNIEHKCLMRSSVKNILRQHPKYNKPLSSTTSPLSSPKKHSNKTTSTTTKPHSPSRSKKCLSKKHSKTKQNPVTPVSSNLISKNAQQTYTTNNIIPSSSPLTGASSKFKALYVIINNTSLLTYNEKIKLIYLNQHLLHLHHIPNILNNSLLHIQNKITKLKLNEIKLNSNEQDVVNKLTTFPTDTAIKGVDMLCKYKGNDNDNEYEKEVMNMVFICLNKTNDAERFDNVKQGYEWLFKEIGVCSIKEMFYEEVFRKVYRELKCDNIDEIIKVVEMNKDVIENENKELYYIHFVVKEIAEFLKQAKDILNENANEENNNNNIKKEVIRLNMLKYYMKIEENIKKGIN